MSEIYQEHKDKCMLALAFKMATHSHAVRLKVGAVLAKGNGDIVDILSVGCNHTTDGYSDVCEKAISIDNEDIIPKTPSEAQMFKDMGCHLVTNDYVIHAEATALMEALRHNCNINGCTMYVTDEPCAECAKLIVASGLTRVVYSREYRLHIGTEILERGGVEVICIPMTEEEISRLLSDFGTSSAECPSYALRNYYKGLPQMGYSDPEPIRKSYESPYAKFDRFHKNKRRK